MSINFMPAGTTTEEHVQTDMVKLESSETSTADGTYGFKKISLVFEFHFFFNKNMFSQRAVEKLQRKKFSQYIGMIYPSNRSFIRLLLPRAKYIYLIKRKTVIQS